MIRLKAANCMLGKKDRRSSWRSSPIHGVVQKFVEDVGDTAVVMQDARMMGNQMTLLLSPNKNKL